jgi:D-proline reductase (dithiol) PrdB
MSEHTTVVDGFRFLPPSLGGWIKASIPVQEFSAPIPWTPMAKPLNRATIALVTSAGISPAGEPPFDMAREKREPTWGDPTFRVIARQATGADVSVNHLHINTDYIRQDINVMLPLARMAELESEGVVGRLAQSAYSFYGFQWQSTAFIETAIAPMAERMEAQGVDAVLLTPA